MNKLFRPKCLRRVLLCLALLFPIVYLCGGLFFALAGSHGNQLFADEVNSSYKMEVNSLNGGYYNNSGELTYYSLSSATDKIAIEENTTYVFNGLENVDTITRYKIFYWDNDDTFIEGVDVYNNNFPIVIPLQGSYFAINLISSVALSNGYSIANFTINGDISIKLNYSDYIFSQPFESNNFITSLGKDLVNGSTKGFNPMNELFRSINSNIMNFDDTDNLAMFGLGYVYYAVNVLIVYEVLILAVKLIMLPLKAVDLFDKEDKL